MSKFLVKKLHLDLCTSFQKLCGFWLKKRGSTYTRENKVLEISLMVTKVTTLVMARALLLKSTVL